MGGLDLTMNGKDVMITVWKVEWAFYGLLLGKRALPRVINALASNVMSVSEQEQLIFTVKCELNINVSKLIIEADKVNCFFC